jgi:hypothetical protein
LPLARITREADDEAGERRGVAMTISTFDRRVLAPRVSSARRWRWLVVLVVAAVVAGFVAVTWRDSRDGPGDSLGRVDPATYFATPTFLAMSDGGIWAWDGLGSGRIGRYEAGDWYRYPELPEETLLSDLAVAADGTPVAGTSSGVYRLEDGAWHRAPDSPAGAVRVDVDPVTGVEWWSAESGLYRWNGSTPVRLPDPPSPVAEAYPHQIVAGGDGTLWVSGIGGYFPDLGGLARYRDSDGSWESVRPLGGFEDIPAELVRTPDAGLWARLADWSRDWARKAQAGEIYAVWSLARFDGLSQRWTTYEPGPSEVYPGAMAADADAVWLAQGEGGMAGFDQFQGVLRFDGGTWTRYLENEVVTGVAIADDGTIWVSTAGEPGVHELDTSSGASHPSGYPTATVVPAPLPDAVVVSLGDSLTGTWAEGYAGLVSDETGANVVGVTFWEGGDVDLAALVRANSDAVAAADVVLIEVDPYPVFVHCGANRTCRTSAIAAYEFSFGALLDQIVHLRGGDRFGIAVVSLGFWAGGGLVGPDFYGSEGWSRALEDMRAWFDVVRVEASERQIAVVDVNAELLGADYTGRMPGGLTTDGIHLSTEGNAEVVRILSEHDDTFGWTP